MNYPVVPFEVWKQELHEDYTKHGLFAFDALGDGVLRVLWVAGIEPSVNGILQAVSSDQ